MSEQPEAFRLAEWLENHLNHYRTRHENFIQAAAELRRLHEVNQELVEALEECADELTCWISDRYPEDNLKFPSIRKDFEMDMTVVEKARAAIAKARNGESNA